MIDRWDILTKTVTVPQFLFGATFDRGAQPYQDFASLVRVRNEVTHFKMASKTPKLVNDLARQGVFMTSPSAPRSEFPWPSRISCTEGIRWAINTLAAMASELHDWLAEDRSP